MTEETNHAKKSYRTRFRIMDAFVDLMADKDFDTITVKSLVEKANITRGTFYLYFSDIYGLVGYMEDALLEEMPDITPGHRPPRDPRTPPTLSECSDSSWERTWFEYYDQFSRYLNALMGPHGDQSFTVKMKRRIQESLTSSMALDTMPMDKYQEYFVNLLPHVFLFLAREWTSNKDKSGLQLDNIVDIALTIRIGSIYRYYLDLTEKEKNNAKEPQEGGTL